MLRCLRKLVCQNDWISKISFSTQYGYIIPFENLEILQMNILLSIMIRCNKKRKYRHSDISSVPMLIYEMIITKALSINGIIIFKNSGILYTNSMACRAIVLV